MENNRWYVYTTMGEYLGLCDLRFGNDVMIIPAGDSNLALKEYVAANPQCTLHLDNQSSTQAWIITVMQPYEGRDNEFWIDRNNVRSFQYSRPKAPSWYTHIPGWKMLTNLWNKLAKTLNK